MPSTTFRAASRAASIALALSVMVSGCKSTNLMDSLHLKDVEGTRSEDPWTTQAGTEGRAGRAVEKEYDPLNLKKLMMSEKAREIERNCGVE